MYKIGIRTIYDCDVNYIQKRFKFPGCGCSLHAYSQIFFKYKFKKTDLNTMREHKKLFI